MRSSCLTRLLQPVVRPAAARALRASTTIAPRSLMMVMSARVRCIGMTTSIPICSVTGKLIGTRRASIATPMATICSQSMMKTKISGVTPFAMSIPRRNGGLAIMISNRKAHSSGKTEATQPILSGEPGNPIIMLITVAKTALSSIATITLHGTTSPVLSSSASFARRIES